MSALLEKLCRLIDEAGLRIQFGLAQQGHLPTVARMVEEGASWDEIGKAIGWCGEAAREHWEFEQIIEGFRRMLCRGFIPHAWRPAEGELTAQTPIIIESPKGWRIERVGIDTFNLTTDGYWEAPPAHGEGQEAWEEFLARARFPAALEAAEVLERFER